MKITTLVGVAVAALLLSGCTAEPAQNGKENTPPGASTAPDAPLSGEDCGGLTTEALEQLFGAELAGPEPKRGDNDQNGVTWTDTGCDWENEAVDLELDLDIAVASDFPDGTVGCFEPGGSEVTTVDGIGTQAWWKFDDLNEAEGTLRVCTDDALIDFEIDAESGSYTSDELRDKAMEAIRPMAGG